MLKKTVTYEDFAGNERSRVLYFNISRAEITRIMIEETDYIQGEEEEDAVAREYLSARIDGVMKRGKGKEMMELFDWLLMKAYGEIAEDGETFVKGEELYTKWTQTASYDAFYFELLTDANFAAEFVKGVLPEELMEGIAEKAEQDPEFKRHREMLEKHKKSQ